MRAAKSSLSVRNPQWRIIGSPADKRSGSKRFLEKSTSGKRNIPTASNCQTDCPDCERPSHGNLTFSSQQQPLLFTRASQHAERVLIIAWRAGRMRTIVLVVLILLLLGALPTWPYSSGWGYYPSGGLGLVLLIVVILALTGRL